MACASPVSLGVSLQLSMYLVQVRTILYATRYLVIAATRVRVRLNTTVVIPHDAALALFRKMFFVEPLQVTTNVESSMRTDALALNA